MPVDKCVDDSVRKWAIFVWINWGKQWWYAKIELVAKVIPKPSSGYTKVVHRFS
jgi:hypothetical protein